MTTKSILCVGVGVPRLPADWELMTAATPAEARRHYKARPCAVGLLIVQESDRSEDLHAFLLDHWAVHWVAVLPPAALEQRAWRHLVRDHCIDYHTTPVDHERLRHTLGHALGMAALRSDDAAARADDDAMLAGQSAAIQRLRRQIMKVASASAPVLIWGESGSGKELAAQAVHAHSPRRKGPFVPINCGAIPATLIHRNSSATSVAPLPARRATSAA